MLANRHPPPPGQEKRTALIPSSTSIGEKAKDLARKKVKLDT